jgi:hypothetical protein
MAFVRKRNRRYQLVVSYREGGKVRQRLASLGTHPTVEEALRAFRERVAFWEAAFVRNEQARGPRAHRRRDKERAEITERIALARAELARLEDVVSTISRQRDKVDTTTNSKSRRVNNVPTSGHLKAFRSGREVPNEP